MDYKICEAKWYETVDKAHQDYNSLTPDERIWFNIRVLIDAANNGGLISYYYNSGADHLAETMKDLEQLGHKDAIQIIEQINAQFPDANPSRDLDERNAVISSLPDDEERDEFMESLDTRFYHMENDLEDSLDVVVKRIMGL